MYKIHPHISFLWLTPTSVQFGAEAPVVTLPSISPGEERIISALLAGVSDVSLSAIAEDAEVTPQELHTLLACLEPAMIRSPQPPAPTRLRIAIDGNGQFAEIFSQKLLRHDHSVAFSTAANMSGCDVAFLVGQHAIEPHRAGAWLRRDVTHVPIIFGDRFVRVGPVIGSKNIESPCMQCLFMHAIDENPNWLTLASQLVHRPSASENLLMSEEIAVALVRWLTNPSQGLITHQEVLVIDSHTGKSNVVRYDVHPECACLALPRNVSVLDLRPDRFPALPRTEPICDVPA